MSFLLELEVENLTDEEGAAVEAAAKKRGTWPVCFSPSSRRVTIFGPRETGPELWMPEQLDSDRHLLSDEATWDAAAWVMEPALLPSLAAAVRLLGELLPQGFSFRATWAGSEVRREQVLNAEELVEMVLASKLNEFTRYRVPPRTDLDDA